MKNNIDISRTIVPKSDQLNADDLIAGAKIITIRDVKLLDSDIQPVQIFFEGDNNKPYKPSKGMRRVLLQLWGADASKYIGKSLKLYRDDNVKYAGDFVGGIRISHASHISGATRVITTISKGKRKSIIVEQLGGDLQTQAPVNYSKQAASLRACTTIEQLKGEYFSLSRDEQVGSESVKDEMKSKLTLTQQQQ